MNGPATPRSAATKMYFFGKKGGKSGAHPTPFSDIDTDANDAGKLFESLQDEDFRVFAHVGGRYADIHYAHDGKLETAMEINSAGVLLNGF